MEARRRRSTKSVNQLWRVAFAREVGLPAEARRIEAQCRAKAGAEGGIRSDHFDNNLMARDFRPQMVQPNALGHQLIPLQSS